MWPQRRQTLNRDIGRGCERRSRRNRHRKRGEGRGGVRLDLLFQALMSPSVPLGLVCSTCCRGQPGQEGTKAPSSLWSRDSTGHWEEEKKKRKEKHCCCVWAGSAGIMRASTPKPSSERQDWLQIRFLLHNWLPLRCPWCPEVGCEYRVGWRCGEPTLWYYNKLSYF